MPLDAHDILGIKNRCMIPCLYHFYRDPPVIARGAMQYLYAADGTRYLDAYAGVTVMNCGHANPAIIEPAIAQLRQLQHTTTIYLSEPIYRLAEDLVRFLDCSLQRVFFVNSGSEANDGALLLARLYTGKPGFIALRGGLHGRTAATMSVTGIDMWRTDPFPAAPVTLAPRPLCSECTLCSDRSACDFACLKPVEERLRQGDVAACIVEPIQGNGGIAAPPPGYFPRLRSLLDAAGALLIFDEVQCGFGRTGADFRFKSLGLEPDILTLAKALGNGFPIGAFCASEQVAAAYTRPGASTTGGNALSAAAAIAVLGLMRREKLPERAKTLGTTFRKNLARIAESCPWTSEIRGDGLMLGMPLTENGTPLPDLTDHVLEKMKDKGFLIGKTGPGRNVLTFMPPLVIEEEDLHRLADALHETLEQAAKTRPAPTSSV